MSDTIFRYPLDLSGLSPDNKFIDESHTIGLTRGRIFATDYGPFFGNSVQIRDAVTNRLLVPREDFLLIHYYREASVAAGQPVYAAVRIINPDVSTEILVSGQYVGGEFSYSTYAIKQAIEALNNDDRPVYWGDIVGLPTHFNPAPHLHSAYDLYGLMHMIESQYEIAAAIREGDVESRQQFLDQARSKFGEIDSFCLELAGLYRVAAEELAQL